MIREKLPDTRKSRIHKVVVKDEQTGDNWDVYVTTGFYPDGRLGEVFLSVGKQGSTLQGLLDSWAKLLSVALQYGLPLAEVLERFTGDQYPPAGLTSDGGECTSLIDCVVTYLVKL